MPGCKRRGVALPARFHPRAGAMQRTCPERRGKARPAKASSTSSGARVQASDDAWVDLVLGDERPPRALTSSNASSQWSSKRMALERINLNVPPAARRRLKAIAKQLRKTESEVARDLLLEGIDRAERAAFYRQVADETTPALRERLLFVAEALEDLDGRAR